MSVRGSLLRSGITRGAGRWALVLVLAMGVLALALLLRPGTTDASHTNRFLITPIGFDFGEVVVAAVGPPATGGGVFAGTQVCGVAAPLFGGTSCPQFTTITNVTDEPQAVSVTLSTVSAPFSATVDCPDTLPPGGSCRIGFRYSPDDVSEPISPDFAILTGDVSGQDLRVDLRGAAVGVKTHRLLFTPTALDFGEVPLGATSSQTVRVTKVIAESSDIFFRVEDTPAFEMSTDCDSPGFNLELGESCQIVYTFRPTSVGGAGGSPEVDIVHTDDVYRSLRVNLRGTGVLPHALAIGTAALPDGTIGQPYSATVEVSGGVGPYIWEAIPLPGGLSLAPFSGVISGTPLVAGEQTVTVRVMDENGAVEEQSFTITVRETGGALTPAPAGPGIHLATWSGGSIDQLVAAAPGTRSVWVSQGGSLIGYVAGAPPFVNAAFLAVFGGGPIPAGTPVVVVR